MNKIIVLILGIIICVSCKTEDTKHQPTLTNQKPEIQTNNLIAVEYAANPESVKAGEPAELIFEVKSVGGETIKDFDIVHEKPMHLLIVSEDLSEFYHLHPEQQTDSKFKTSFLFPNGGYYRLYADFTPTGSGQIVKDFTQTVVGTERAKVTLQADENLEKTVEGLRVVMKPDSVLENGKETMLNFQVFDAATNQPVTDLENYLGELAHFVIISEDLRDFVHAYPVSRDNVKSTEHSSHEHGEKLMSKDAESIVSAHVTFPNAAKYKIWVQFQRGGKIVNVPFVVEIGKNKTENTLAKVNIPEGAFKIVVSKNGFTPQEITFQKGQPLKLAFVRIDDENCGNEIVFKDLNIKKKLPVGEVVTIDIPTEKSGEINFTCGMNMMKGKIIIQQ
ncbi:hypothetical protein BH20ACI4_BH20ACI4_23500 [soil metagenome]